MKDTEPDYTSHISLNERSIADRDTQCMIQKSLRRRDTEYKALKDGTVKDSGYAVTDKPPGEGYHWCSMCGWRKRDRFNAHAHRKSGIDNYCKECRRKIRLRQKSIDDIPHKYEF